MKRFLSPTLTLWFYLFLILALFLYSFTQIDLSLTFSRASFLQEIQKGFQYIGYFNRPLSAQLFLIFITALFVCFERLLDLIRQKKIPATRVWVLIAATTFLFFIAYNAFSHDLFNYIFDAKIVTYYQENPYAKRAIDYPGDPMLSFMHWTHRVYPYGPVWLVLSLPFSFLGFQKFALTFYLFKLLMAGAFVGTVYFLYQTLKKITPEHALLGTAFFALNPLVLIESLVSAHNDIVMMFMAVLSLFFLSRKRFILAALFLFLSVGVKFATVFLLPAFIYVLYFQVKKKAIPWEKTWFFMLLLMTGALITASLRTNFQPWYLLYLLPFAALLSYKRAVSIPMTLLSMTALLNYLPYLSMGNWDPPIPGILFYLNIFSAVLAVGIFLFFSIMKRHEKPV